MRSSSTFTLKRPALLALTVAAVSFGSVASAAAQASVPGEVLIVLAKEEPGPVDPALRDLSALRRAPFDSFESMEVLSRPRVRLRVTEPQRVELPNGRRVQLTLQQVLPNGRYRVQVSINRPNQNDYLPLLTVVASPGDPFFVAGQNHDGGTLIIGVRVGTAPASDGKGEGAPPSRLLRR